MRGEICTCFLSYIELCYSPVFILSLATIILTLGSQCDNMLEIPLHSSSLYSSSFTVTTPRHWNSLLPEVKGCRTLKSFKSNLENYDKSIKDGKNKMKGYVMCSKVQQVHIPWNIHSSPGEYVKRRFWKYDSMQDPYYLPYWSSDEYIIPPSPNAKESYITPISLLQKKQSLNLSKESECIPTNLFYRDSLSQCNISQAFTPHACTSGITQAQCTTGGKSLRIEMSDTLLLGKKYFSWQQSMGRVIDMFFNGGCVAKSMLLLQEGVRATAANAYTQFSSVQSDFPSTLYMHKSNVLPS
ncbi:hypothetical protein ANN_09821 [Periplaneta americana]|uniref:Uncharacterized protein n=1 Tax=Periplaneta americana TaxID=6978 RepID=A0ABQ8TPN0_PERAM|nr:hypothetical protein ANN_09821 [Periplaneta americana]